MNRRLADIVISFKPKPKPIVYTYGEEPDIPPINYKKRGFQYPVTPMGTPGKGTRQVIVVNNLPPTQQKNETEPLFWMPKHERRRRRQKQMEEACGCSCIIV